MHHAHTCTFSVRGCGIGAHSTLEHMHISPAVPRCQHGGVLDARRIVVCGSPLITLKPLPFFLLRRHYAQRLPPALPHPVPHAWYTPLAFPVADVVDVNRKAVPSKIKVSAADKRGSAESTSILSTDQDGRKTSDAGKKPKMAFTCLACLARHASGRQS